MAKITFTIDDAKLAEFKAGFLKKHPVPIDEDTEVPEFTDNEWLKEWGKRAYINAYRTGKKKIAQDTIAPVTDDNIVN